MALPSGSLVRVANQPTSGVGVLANSPTTAGALGSNTNGVDIFTAGTYGSRVISLIASTDDNVAIVNVWLYIYRGTTVIPIGLVPVAINSGNTNAVRFAVDFLNGSNIPGLPIDNTGRQYIPLLAGDILKASTIAQLTSGKTCWINCSALDYLAP
jgi:hypothetical protein